MIDAVYRIVPVYRDWLTGRVTAFCQLNKYNDLRGQWSFGRKYESELFISTMKEF